MTLELSRDEISRIVARTPPTDVELLCKLHAVMNEVQAITVADLRSILDPAWQRHAKRNGKVYQVVVQLVIGKSEQIDWDRFRCNHPLFCDYWDSHGWQFCGESLIDWIDNGCCPPPREPTKAQANTRVSRIGNRE